MTKSFDNRTQLAAQGALQAIISYGAESVHLGTGYTHTITIIANGNRGIVVKSEWFTTGQLTDSEEAIVDILTHPDALKAGWDAAFKNILKIEHRQGRCVA